MHSAQNSKGLENKANNPSIIFRSRFLTDENNVFQENAWDNVEWDEKQIKHAKEMVKENSIVSFSEEEKNNLEISASSKWNDFYTIHDNKFFKDRNWLFTEFPELHPDSGCTERLNILEIGCGVGNTIFPILKVVQNNVFVYGCDFSSNAINILKENPIYDESRCCAFVCDVTADDWQAPFEAESLDIVTLIFALSAIDPKKMPDVVAKIFFYLKPGGLLLFRDYGLYDMAQLRFKKGRCLGENFYARGDGTLVYFFTQGEVKELFERVGFIEEQNLMDKRLQVNRLKQMKMYRVWIQAKYRKLKKQHEQVTS